MQSVPSAYSLSSYASEQSAIENSFMSALAFIVWDILITLDDEVERIWSKPSRSLVKWLYIWMRYLPLLTLIVYFIVQNYLLTSVIRVTVHVCRGWYGWENMSIVVVASSINLVQLLRVYALYNKNRVIFAIAALILGCEPLVPVVALFVTLPHIQFTSICTPLNTIVVLYFCGGAIISQTAVVGLTVSKHIYNVRRGCGNIPIVLVVARDGAFYYITMLVFLILELTLFFHYRRYFAAIGYHWFMSLASSFGTRLVINMEKVASSDEEEYSQDTELGVFTTVFSDTQADTRALA